jgi:hypothetical protein
MHLDVLVVHATGREPEPFCDGWSTPAPGIRPDARLTKLTGDRASQMKTIEEGAKQ